MSQEFHAATLDEIRAMYLKWQNDPRFYETYRNFMIENLFYFVQSRAALFFSHLSGTVIEKDDLIHDGIVAICVNLKNYDPTREDAAMPTTFFLKFIDAAIKDTTNEKKLTKPYYIYNGLKLEELVKANGFKGLDDPNLTIAMLSELSGLSLKRIQSVFDLKDRQVVSFGEDDSWVTSASTEGNPETAVINQETLDAFASAVLPLTDFERRVIALFFFEKEKVKDDDGKKTAKESQKPQNSTRYVVRELKTDKEFLREVGIPESKITSYFVDQTKERALGKLRGNLKIRRQYEKPDQDNTSPVKPVDEATIIEAIENGEIFPDRENDQDC